MLQSGYRAKYLWKFGLLITVSSAGYLFLIQHFYQSVSKIHPTQSPQFRNAARTTERNKIISSIGEESRESIEKREINATNSQDPNYRSNDWFGILKVCFFLLNLRESADLSLFTLTFPVAFNVKSILECVF